MESYNLKLGTYYFYDQYFVSEINEGEVITLEKLDDLIPLVIKHYGDGKPFTYISNRINSHSITPLDYLNCPLNAMENFKGYGVVAYNKNCKISLEIEKHFAKRPFHQFDDLKSAINWTGKQLLA